ncbi:MAG: hypothetical protein HYY24_02180 [Verrucomicrobia bacterium]|nr:hypothetical protein [Verrucomicrobiota bacterium]
MPPLVDDLSRREFISRLTKLGVVCSASAGPMMFAAADAQLALPDPALTFPGPWAFTLPKGGIILVSDQQLEDLTDPDKEVDLSLSATPNRTTLRKLCEQQRAAGAKTIILAFDEFWSQYRAGQGGQPRALTPDLDEYLRRIVRISETLKAHGLGLELSLLSPLEIGRGYAKKTGESGRWVHYREGWRDPRTGRFRVSLWEQLRWTNNKGTIELARAGVRVFAFRERRVGRTSFYAVNPAEIVELKQPVEIEAAEPDNPRVKERRLTISGSGDTQVGPLNRVLVIVSYAVPEMDYFSPQALPFLEDLVRRYHQASVPLHGLYADEMHIQQDWGYASHHEEGQFALRYLTPHLARRFAELHGAEFADLEKHLVYFCYGQHGFLPNLEARLAAQHVFGDSPEDIQRTFLLRRRYFDLLEKTVVDLFTATNSRPARTRRGRRVRRLISGAPATRPTHRGNTTTRPTFSGRTRSSSLPRRALIIFAGTLFSPAAATTTPRAAGRIATTTRSRSPARPASSTARPTPTLPRGACPPPSSAGIARSKTPSAARPTRRSWRSRAASIATSKCSCSTRCRSSRAKNASARG